MDKKQKTQSMVQRVCLLRENTPSQILWLQSGIPTRLARASTAQCLLNPLDKLEWSYIAYIAVII